jgi:hypothetical protein
MYEHTNFLQEQRLQEVPLQEQGISVLWHMLSLLSVTANAELLDMLLHIPVLQGNPKPLGLCCLRYSCVQLMLLHAD